MSQPRDTVDDIPTLGFALLADYARADGGIAHVVAAGIDHIFVQQTPAGQNIGLLLRIVFRKNECGRPHSVEVFCQDEDGERLIRLSGTVQPVWNDEWPATWRSKTMVAFNIGMPIPRLGLYEVEILINDTSVKTLPIRVVPLVWPSKRARDEVWLRAPSTPSTAWPNAVLPPRDVEWASRRETERKAGHPGTVWISGGLRRVRECSRFVSWPTTTTT